MSRRALFRPSPAGVRQLHDRLLEAYGRQGWWPGDTRLEIVVGAVLTQNTAWSNVEKAVGNLRSAGVIDVARLLALPVGELAALIRPAGYFNVKAVRLRNLLEAIAQAGGERTIARRETPDLRALLLAVKGVGPETADDILLYAFDRPVFVVDAYTRRVFGRLGWARGDEAYEELRHGTELAAEQDLCLLQELHALIVAHAKAVCRKRPRCDACVLGEVCRRSGLAPG